MNPWFVFVAMFAVLTAIRRRWFKVHHTRARVASMGPDHAALIRAEAAALMLAHLHVLLDAVNKELARRQQQKV